MDHLRLPLVLCVSFAVALAFAGCFEFPEGPDAGEGPFVLAYRLVDLTGDDAERYANPGVHCGTASLRDGQLMLGFWPDEEMTEGPWLTVFPELESPWRAGIDGEPFKTMFPHEVVPRVQDEPTILGELSWVEQEDGNGTILLDGVPLSLPHSWATTAGDGSWKAEATLYAWEGDVEFERYQGLCD